MKGKYKKPIFLVLFAVLLVVVNIKNCNAQAVDVDDAFFQENFECPQGWKLYCEKCYLFEDSPKSWTDAQYKCKQEGGNLVTIHDYKTNDFLSRWITAENIFIQNVYIGLNDRANEGSFKWADGSPAVDKELLWSNNEPSSGTDEDCVELGVGGPQYLWNNVKCTDALSYVCQVNACVAGSFRCDNGLCIDKSRQCDGVNQCGDGSDERFCQTSTCGGALTGNAGTITSPNHPNNYPHNLDCTWTIETQKDTRIEITFEVFELEDSAFDFLQVYDSKNTEKNNKIFDGFGKINPPILLTTGNVALVSFISDESQAFKGFRLRYRSVTQQCYEVASLRNGESKTINSTNYPKNYPDSIECIYIISSLDNNMLTLTFLDLDTEEKVDVIEIKDGADKNQQLLGTFSGKRNVKEIMPVLSSTGKFWIRFISDSTNNSRGFKAVINTGCGADLDVNSGIILSPGFGYQNYPLSIKCVWKISSPAKQKLSFKFHFFETEKDYDFLYMKRKDNSSVHSPLSGAITVPPFPTYFVQTTQETFIHLEFISEDTNTYRGFNISFSPDCPALSVDGGKVVGLNHYDAEVDYVCDDTHFLKNGKTRVCLFGGVWSKPQPICEKTDCGAPEPIANGGYFAKPITKDFIKDVKIIYFCNKFYELVGNKERVCQRNSTWTGTKPYCKVAQCPPLFDIANGKRNGDDFKVGSSVTFECDEGYRLDGQSKLSCSEEGTWSAPTPKCEQILCRAIGTPNNGHFVGKVDTTVKLPFGTTVELDCDPGYQVKDNSKSTCKSKGEWDPPIAKCENIDECKSTDACKGPGSICIDTLGDYECLCKPGFEKTDAKTCADVDECNDPNHQPKCSHSCKNSVGQYSCLCPDGYFLFKGDETGLTNKEKINSVVGHTCLGVSCPTPVIPDKGMIMDYGKRYPAKIQYHCNPDYLLKGSEFLNCLKTGKWDKDFPDCVVAFCKIPSSPADTTSVISGESLSPTQYKPKSTITYSCAKGHKYASGDLVRYCEKNMTHAFWSGKPPVCEKKECPTLDAPMHGKVDIKSNKYEGIAIFSCDNGYALIGPSTIHCTEDGKWNDTTTPQCIATACPAPEVKDFSTFVGKLIFGETITYSCTKKGYELQSSATRTCLYDLAKGTNYWSGVAPACKDVKPPTFTCPATQKFNLPKSEKVVLVDWVVPTATDNTGDDVTVKTDSFSPPQLFKAGKYDITYTSTDKSGNTGSCVVQITVVDAEKPKVKCPSNIFVNSDFPEKVYWQPGHATDNDGIASIEYNPKNGSTFESNKYHRIVMTVTDTSGNKDTCVTEVYVKGCGCESRRQCNVITPPNGGTATCTEVPPALMACKLECKKPKVFTVDHFNGDNVICSKGKWQVKTLPGCADPKNPITCAKMALDIKYQSAIDVTTDVTTQLTKMFNNLNEQLNKLSDIYCNEVTFTREDYQISNDLVKVNYKLTPNEEIMIDSIATVTNGCIDSAKKFLTQASALQIVADSVIGLNAQSIGVAASSKCCTNGKDFCCEDGHHIRYRGVVSIKNVKCYACLPGTYLNKSSNACEACPIGNYADLSAMESCKKCPAGTSSLKTQSTECTKMCDPGTYSSTGLVPTCRLCDYGEYQTEAGKMKCEKCAGGQTTESRGSAKLSDCKAPCAKGEYSTSGLQPCGKCDLGTYQDETGKSVCKPCGKGIYAGKVGATKKEECPTKDACDLKLCQNGASCTTGNYSYTCNCKAGYTGKNCDVDIDECKSSPCQNGGNCKDAVADYNCTCVEGFTGKSCETNIDDCSPNPCKNNAVCEDKVNDFKCICKEGYKGVLCDVMINKCIDLEPCMNKATCDPLLNDYKCTCQAGFSGKNCSINIDECASGPCQHEGVCEDLINDYKCTCKPGYTSKNCETNIDECENKPCMNNGTCFDGINDFTCNCLPGYTGKKCSINIDECDPNPCLHKSTCKDLIDDFECYCQPGYKGKRCETDINECLTNTCYNNATCVDKVNDYSCLCTIGFTGKNCETNIDECASKPCKHGKCIDGIAEYSCVCDPGYTGENCTIEINECEVKPCENSGNCTDLINDYSCTCSAGYDGKNCSVDIDECDPDPCVNAINCTNLINNYVCFCKPGYKGKNCSIEIDNCKPTPCVHGKCSNNFTVDNGFVCACDAGYTGEICDKEIDECQPKPCVNNATCTDKLADYECNCLSGYTGKNCETNIDDCVNSSCINGGECDDGINEYTCNCPVTHKGKFCEKKIPNEVDFTFKGGESYLVHGNISSVEEFSLSVWVRYLSESKGEFLVLSNMKNNKVSSVFLKITESSLQFSFIDMTDVFEFNKKLNKDPYWHHVFVSASGKTGKLMLYIDGKNEGEEDYEDLKGKKFFDPSGMLLLGRNENGSGFIFDSGFIGQISQLVIWEKTFTEAEILNLASDCVVDMSESIVPWIGLLAGKPENVTMSTKFTCGINKCPDEWTGKFCDILIDTTPPEIKYCPGTMKIVTADRSIRVSWKTPEFTDNVKVTKIVSSHSPGETFEWGGYPVAYIAKDAFNNSATCVFYIYVTPHNCSNLKEPKNAVYVQGTWEWGEYFDFKCSPKYELAVPRPPIYVCGKDGNWRHGPPIYPENPQNLLPSCSLVEEPIATSTNSFAFSTSTCDKDFQQKFVKKFKEKIMSYQNQFPICGESCDFTNILLRCSASPATLYNHRVRRDATNQFSLEISFKTMYSKNVSSIAESTQTVQGALKKHTMNMSVEVDGKTLNPDESKTNIETPTLSCTDGKVIKNDKKCVACPAGTFKNSSTECHFCPIGTYSIAGKSACTSCVAGATTFGEGATSNASCIAPCGKGSFYNNGTCKLCEYGFYKDTVGLEICKPCPAGRSTKTLGVTTVDECKSECALGEELVGEVCKPCDEGFYRSDKTQTRCLNCPYGFTTFGNGSKENICKRKCSLGYETTEDKEDCIPCDIGYFRDNTTYSQCKKCPMTASETLSYGSKSSSDCFAEMTDRRKYDVIIRFTELKWDEKLADKESSVFRNMANTIAEKIMKLYVEENILRTISLSKFQSGSIVAFITLDFEKSSDPLRNIRAAVDKGEVDGLEVDSNSLKIDQCPYVKCPADRTCWSNNTVTECVCSKDKYGTPDGKCFVSCTSDYCLNGGACDQSSTGRTCRCSKDYSGERCETSEKTTNVGMIVGIIIAVVFLILIFAYFVRRQQRVRTENLYKRRKLDGDFFSKTQTLESLSETPISTPTPLVKAEVGVDNRGVDIGDGNSKNTYELS